MKHHRPDFIFMDDNARICQTEWPALSPDLNPIENPWDKLSCHVEGCNPAPQNLNDLRAALQEEWSGLSRH
uniref:Tc1-like transposase DDE domain-containing protein n=1 Tax=Lates calcarifer TaxID=8187 RepID=A0A4W6C9T0_LATCA